MGFGDEGKRSFIVSAARQPKFLMRQDGSPRPAARPLHELQRRHLQARRAVEPRCLQRLHHLTGGVVLNALTGMKATSVWLHSTANNIANLGVVGLRCQEVAQSAVPCGGTSATTYQT